MTTENAPSDARLREIADRSLGARKPVEFTYEEQVVMARELLLRRATPQPNQPTPPFVRVCPEVREGWICALQDGHPGKHENVHGEQWDAADDDDDDTVAISPTVAAALKAAMPEAFCKTCGNGIKACKCESPWSRINQPGVDGGLIAQRNDGVRLRWKGVISADSSAEDRMPLGIELEMKRGTELLAAGTYVLQQPPPQQPREEPGQAVPIELRRRTPEERDAYFATKLAEVMAERDAERAKREVLQRIIDTERAEAVQRNEAITEDRRRVMQERNEAREKLAAAEAARDSEQELAVKFSQANVRLTERAEVAEAALAAETADRRRQVAELETQRAELQKRLDGAIFHFEKASREREEEKAERKAAEATAAQLREERGQELRDAVMAVRSAQSDETISTIDDVVQLLRRRLAEIAAPAAAGAVVIDEAPGVTAAMVEAIEPKAKAKATEPRRDAEGAVAELQDLIADLGGDAAEGLIDTVTCGKVTAKIMQRIAALSQSPRGDAPDDFVPANELDRMNVAEVVTQEWGDSVERLLRWLVGKALRDLAAGAEGGT